MVRFRNRTLLPTLEGTLLVMQLMAGLTAVLTLLVAVTSGTIEELRIGVALDSLRDVLPAGVTPDSADAIVTADADLGYRLAWWLVGPAASLLVVAGAYILREVVLTARSGDPFLATNVRRLRILGGLTVAYFVFSIARSMAAVVIQRHLGVDDVRTAVSFAPIVSAVVLFALAEIWRWGVQLRDEQQLTV